MEPNNADELKAERSQKLKLAILAESDGGKLVIEAARKDIQRLIGQLATEYRTGAHFDLVRLCADLNAALSLYQTLTRAPKHVKELDEMIEDALHE
jgi:hypothetical protein